VTLGHRCSRIGALCALSLVLGPAVGARAAPARVVRAFGAVTLDDLGRRPGLALGLLSASQGGYAPEQALLDVSQGARVLLPVYEPERPPPLALVRGRIRGWAAALRRARRAAGDLMPGLLGSAIPGGAAYAGAAGDAQRAAIAAAGRRGGVAAASLGPAATLAARAGALGRAHRLVVVGVLAGRAGRATLDGLLRARARRDLVLVVRAPPARGGYLLPMGAAGLGPGALRSATTRRDGLVASTDLAPRILRRLGLPVPSAIKGEAITAVPGGGSAAGVAALDARLAAVPKRRLAAFGVLLAAWLTALGVRGALSGRAGLRRGLRWGGLAALWLPAVLLLTAALEPSAAVELAVVAAGSLLLAALTDLILPWPRGPAAPAAVALTAYAVDLIAGSPLLVRSLLGPDPRFGSRFYGINNELEIVLPLLLFLGLAALPLTGGRSARGALAFALGGAALAVVIGAGRLGADVGGVITIGAGAAAATLLMLPGGVTRRAVAVAACVPVVALALLAVLDLFTGGNAHFERTILQAGSAGSVGETLGRRYELAVDQLERGPMPLLTALAAGAAAAAVWRRRSLYQPVLRYAGWRAALAGGLVAAVAGSLVNDAGPVLLVYGVALLATATAYARGDPGGRR
jgi:hypothetical protein